MLKVGLAGVGHISKAHIPVWQSMENACLTALCSRNAMAMEPYEGVRKYTDYDAMLREEKLHIVDICVPTFLHREYAVKAMEMGCHVICEKPVSLWKEDIARMYDAARANGVQFMVAQVLRFWPAYEYAARFYREGTYGKLLSGNMIRLGRFPSAGHWMGDVSRSGLVAYDLHIHDLDFMVSTFGRPRNAVFRRTTKTDQDHLSVMYDFDGFTISAEAGWYAPAFPFRAAFRFQYEEALVLWEQGRMSIYQRDGQVLHPLEQELGGVEKSVAFTRQLTYFADCVQAGKPADKIRQEELETVLDILQEYGGIIL